MVLIQPWLVFLFNILIFVEAYGVLLLDTFEGLSQQQLMTLNFFLNIHELFIGYLSQLVVYNLPFTAFSYLLWIYWALLLDFFDVKLLLAFYFYVFLF